MKPCLLAVYALLLVASTTQARSANSISPPATRLLSNVSLEASCASIKSCENCTAVTGCHFCASDHQCHAWGSTSGCMIGMDCKDLRQCVRQVPEFTGYGSPSALVIAGIIAVAILLWGLVGCLTLLVYSLTRKRSAPRSPTSINMAAPAEPEAYRQLDNFELLPMEDRSSFGDRRRGNQAGSSRPSNRCWSCCRGTTIFFSLLILVFIPLAICFFPQMPLYSVCTKKVMWGSILESLTKGKLGTDVELHVAMYNPNRVGAHVHQGSGNVLFKGVNIGSGSLSGITFDAGSITDVVMLTHLSPSLATSLAMLAEHQAGTLLIDVQVEMRTNLVLFRRNLPALNTSFVIDNIQVQAPDTLEYCKCKS